MGLAARGGRGSFNGPLDLAAGVDCVRRHRLDVASARSADANTCAFRGRCHRITFAPHAWSEDASCADTGGGGSLRRCDVGRCAECHRRVSVILRG